MHLARAMQTCTEMKLRNIGCSSCNSNVTVVVVVVVADDAVVDDEVRMFDSV
jgi:hypothetical protein